MHQSTPTSFRRQRTVQKLAIPWCCHQLTVTPMSIIMTLKGRTRTVAVVIMTTAQADPAPPAPFHLDQQVPEESARPMQAAPRALKGSHSCRHLQLLGPIINLGDHLGMQFVLTFGVVHSFVQNRQTLVQHLGASCKPLIRTEEAAHTTPLTILLCLRCCDLNRCRPLKRSNDTSKTEQSVENHAELGLRQSLMHFIFPSVSP